MFNHQFWAMVFGIVFFLSVLFLTYFGVTVAHNRYKECQERGGIPHEELCLHPSAIIK